MKKIRLALVLSLTASAPLLADDGIARVQQELKDQGFYYGEITGEKNGDTTAAIRRFQIRGGLQITGEMDDETLKALAASEKASSNHSVAAATPPPPMTVRPIAPPTSAPTLSQRSQDSDLRADPSDRYNSQAEPPNDHAGPIREQPPTVYPSRPIQPTFADNFARTPFENAPADVQQDLIAQTERKLAKRELYHGAIDGIFNSDLEFSLRAYQSKVGLQPTGRLDLQTLAALELLPGANQPVFIPRRQNPQTPVHGEWVHP